MRLTYRRGLLAVLLLGALAAPARGQGFGFPWWRDPQFQKELSLTTDQSARIDTVFQATMPSLRQKKEELDGKEAELSRLIAANAEEQVVIKLNKARTLLLLHIRQVLTPEQRAKLNKLYEQRVTDRDKRRDRK